MEVIRRFGKRKRIERVCLCYNKRKISTSNSSSKIATSAICLALDVIEQVLLRLPARSVLKFRSACKLFNQLSSTPKFISAHTQCIRDDPLQPTSLAVFRYTFPHIYTLYTGSSKLRAHQQIILDILPPLPLRDYSLPYMLGPTCDGLICFNQLDDDKKIIIFNPLTRQSMSHSLPEYNSDVSILGFYYHFPSREYRLLLKHHPLDKKRSYSVLTLGPNITLRKIQNSSTYGLVLYMGRGGILIQGNWLYCFRSLKGKCLVTSLLVFNVETEEFTPIPFLDDFQFELDNVNLIDIDGKLYLCKMHPIKRHPKLMVELWVLEDSRKRIWVKKRRVDTEILRDREQAYNVITYNNEYDQFFL